MVQDKLRIVPSAGDYVRLIKSGYVMQVLSRPRLPNSDPRVFLITVDNSGRRLQADEYEFFMTGVEYEHIEVTSSYS